MNNPKTIDQILEELYEIWGLNETEASKYIELYNKVKSDLLQAIEGVRPEKWLDNKGKHQFNAGYNKGISDSYKAIKELFNIKGEKGEKGEKYDN